jgi:hypothetical protein
MTRNELIASIRNPLTASLSQLQEQANHLRHTLVSHNWVVAMPNDGQDVRNGAMYFAAIRDSKNPRLMVDVSPVSLENAPRYLREDAEAICRDGNVRNGLGHIARPVPIREAISAQIAHLQSLIDSLNTEQD